MHVKSTVLLASFYESLKVSVFLSALLTLGCGGRLDSSQEEASTEFELCVIYCTLNRSGSEDTECYQPVEKCPEECRGVTISCVREIVDFTECRLNAGAGLVCQDHNDELHPWVDAIDGVCEVERTLREQCVCEYLDIPCEWPSPPE